MNRNFTILQASLKRLKFYQDAADATSVTFIMKNDDTAAVMSFTENYSDGEAVIELDGNDTSVTGIYSYQINENTPNGIIKHGDLNCDDGDCEYGKVIICESLDGVVS